MCCMHWSVLESPFAIPPHLPPPSEVSVASVFMVKILRILQLAHTAMLSRVRKTAVLNSSAVKDTRSMHKLLHCENKGNITFVVRKQLNVLLWGRGCNHTKRNTVFVLLDFWGICCDPDGLIWGVEGIGWILTMFCFSETKGILACRGVAENSLCTVEKYSLFLRCVESLILLIKRKQGTSGESKTLSRTPRVQEVRRSPVKSFSKHCIIDENKSL